jgi:uncharacterized protein YdeI (YjbR/CyaY-like superfamily)
VDNPASADEPQEGHPGEEVASRAEWRAWLETNHRLCREADVVIYKQGPRAGLLTLNDAQEEALCFGWVDVHNRRIDSAADA